MADLKYGLTLPAKKAAAAPKAVHSAFADDDDDEEAPVLQGKPQDGRRGVNAMILKEATKTTSSSKVSATRAPQID
jgi:hypothetical protein